MARSSRGRYSADDRSRDMRRAEFTSQCLSELSDCLVEWQCRREAGWIEIGAMEPPLLQSAAAAVGPALSAALLPLDLWLGGASKEMDGDLKDATRRRFDVVMAWSVDRLGRSLQHLVVTLADLQAAGIDLYLRQKAIDTTTPSGRALFQMLGVFAEFERGMIRERVQSGVDRARAAGKRLGRPRMGSDQAAAIRASLAGGVSIRKAAALYGVGISTVQRVKAWRDLIVGQSEIRDGTGTVI
jgi:hypothetical protein